jgi:hypothetical protein
MNDWAGLNILIHPKSPTFFVLTLSFSSVTDRFEKRSNGLASSSLNWLIPRSREVELGGRLARR